MLPIAHKILFFIFALIVGGYGVWGFYRLYRRVARGAAASELRWDNLPERIGYSLVTSLTQERTFRKRRWISILHACIFYGFTYYLLVNVVDALEGYFHFSILSSNPLGAVYNLLADLLSMSVFIGVIGLVIRRLWTPSKRDFRFTEKTLLHPLVLQDYIKRDSLFVSAFILFHVGSRFVGNAAKMVEEARLHGHFDALQPFASGTGRLLFGGLSDHAIDGWRIFGFWGALGSILLFLSYFPFSKHIHIFMAPLNYALKRPVGSGVLPPMKGLEAAMESEDPKLGVEKLEELEWPRLLDAYSCIQCNRCQDVCPANATGKALSPAALEINKRMELNVIAAHPSPFTLKPAAFETGGASGTLADQPLMEWAINEESVWACTTCGACMQVCPVQDEQMLDIIDIRRQQVMVAGEFPSQLQTAFRGMERTSNPWGISRDKRMDWAEGLKVPTIDENPEPDVIYWVGCAASYDPGAQKVSRAFVQLLDKAGVNYAVLGKKEACTGDAARRAGNEFLYQQLAQENVETLNTVAPKLIVATCPHCMNAIGHEYKQLGGDYRTIHHTEYLETLVAAGKLPTAQLEGDVVYHDPCYLGRHNGVYDAPRKLITQMAGDILDIERQRENSFCCGAGGAQFWKEEEEGRERISDNRFRELQARLDEAAERSAAYANGEPVHEKVVAVGCPFCKAMMNSTPEKQKRDDIVVKDVAELMLESVQRAAGEWHPTQPETPTPAEAVEVPNAALPMERTGKVPSAGASADVVGVTNADIANAQPGSPVFAADNQPEAQAAAPSPNPTDTAAAPARKSWKPKGGDDVAAASAPAPAASATTETGRKAWKPKGGADDVSPASTDTAAASPAAETSAETGRKAWKPKAKADDVSTAPVAQAEAAPTPQPTTDNSQPTQRKAWNPKAKADDVSPAPVAQVETAPTPQPATDNPQPTRKAWNPKAKAQAPAEAEPRTADRAPLTEVLDPLPQPTPDTPQPSTGERKKWQPRAKAEAAPLSTDHSPLTEAPITEHVVLPQVGVNGLEEGQQATSAPDSAQSSAPVTTQPATIPQSTGHESQAEINPETGRKKWTPKK